MAAINIYRITDTLMLAYSLSRDVRSDILPGKNYNGWQRQDIRDTAAEQLTYLMTYFAITDNSDVIWGIMENHVLDRVSRDTLEAIKRLRVYDDTAFVNHVDVLQKRLGRLGSIAIHDLYIDSEKGTMEFRDTVDILPTHYSELLSPPARRRWKRRDYA